MQGRGTNARTLSNDARRVLGWEAHGNVDGAWLSTMRQGCVQAVQLCLHLEALPLQSLRMHDARPCCPAHVVLPDLRHLASLAHKLWCVRPLHVVGGERPGGREGHAVTPRDGMADAAPLLRDFGLRDHETGRLLG